MYEAAKANFYSFDLDKSKALLAEAGIADLTLDVIPNPGDPDLITLAEMYQADLARIGIKLNIIKLDMAAWSDQVNGNKFAGLYISGSNLALSPEPYFTVSRPIGPVNNNEGFESELYSKLVTDLALETEPAKQKQFMSQLNDILLDESFFNFLSPNYFIGVARPGSPQRHAQHARRLVLHRHLARRLAAREGSMKRSTDRILTTHVGSLFAPARSSRHEGAHVKQPYDQQRAGRRHSRRASTRSSGSRSRWASTSPTTASSDGAASRATSTSGWAASSPRRSTPNEILWGAGTSREQLAFPEFFEQYHDHFRFLWMPPEVSIDECPTCPATTRGSG